MRVKRNVFAELIVILGIGLILLTTLLSLSINYKNNLEADLASLVFQDEQVHEVDEVDVANSVLKRFSDEGLEESDVLSMLNELDKADKDLRRELDN